MSSAAEFFAHLRGDAASTASSSAASAAVLTKELTDDGEVSAKERSKFSKSTHQKGKRQTEDIVTAAPAVSALGSGEAEGDEYDDKEAEAEDDDPRDGAEDIDVQTRHMAHTLLTRVHTFMELLLATDESNVEVQGIVAELYPFIMQGRQFVRGALLPGIAEEPSADDEEKPDFNEGKFYELTPNPAFDEEAYSNWCIDTADMLADAVDEDAVNLAMSANIGALFELHHPFLERIRVKALFDDFTNEDKQWTLGKLRSLAALLLSYKMCRNPSPGLQKMKLFFTDLVREVVRDAGGDPDVPLEEIDTKLISMNTVAHKLMSSLDKLMNLMTSFTPEELESVMGTFRSGQTTAMLEALAPGCTQGMQLGGEGGEGGMPGMPGMDAGMMAMLSQAMSGMSGGSVEGGGMEAMGGMAAMMPMIQTMMATMGGGMPGGMQAPFSFEGGVATGRPPAAPSAMSVAATMFGGLSNMYYLNDGPEKPLVDDLD